MMEYKPGSIDELLADVLEKRALAFQDISTESSRLPSPRVFPSEHFRDVLGNILECGDSSDCCLRPSEHRLSVYSQQKLIGRSGRTLYSSGEGRPCHEIIRPMTESSRKKSMTESFRKRSMTESSRKRSTESSRKRSTESSRKRSMTESSKKRSTESSKKRSSESSRKRSMTESSRKRSTESSRKRSMTESSRKRSTESSRKRSTETSRKRSMTESSKKRSKPPGPQTHHGRHRISLHKNSIAVTEKRLNTALLDTDFRKRRRQSRNFVNEEESNRKGHRSRRYDHDHEDFDRDKKTHHGNGRPKKSSWDTERFERVEGQHPDTFRIKNRKKGGKSEGPGRGQDHSTAKLNRVDAGGNETFGFGKRSEKIPKLPPLLSKSQQLKLKRDELEKRKRELEAERSRKRKAQSADRGTRLKLPPIPGIETQNRRNILEGHALDKTSRLGDDDSKGNYTPCEDDDISDIEPKSSEYSSWEMATNIIKKPLKALLGTIPPPHILLAYVRKRFPGEEWHSGCPDGRRCYPDGKFFVASYPNGATNVYYPHGGLAIAISAPRPTHQVLVFRDPLEGFYFLDKSLLAGFNTLGIGVVYNNQGMTKLRYDLEGGYQLQGDSNGQPHRWRWNGAGHRILQKLNQYMTLRILGLDSIHLQFHGNKRGLRFNVGRGHLINLVASNPFPLSRRPWWDAYPGSAETSTVAAKGQGQRPLNVEETDASGWDCCCPAPQCPLTCCSPTYYCCNF